MITETNTIPFSIDTFLKTFRPSGTVIKSPELVNKGAIFCLQPEQKHNENNMFLVVDKEGRKDIYACVCVSE